MTIADDLRPETLTYDSRGLLPVVVQDQTSGAVLMLAYANREAVELTLETGLAHFWSRSRRELWKKGATSGNILSVREILTDCDRDTLLLRVRPAGPACHRGTRSCFEPNTARLELGWLWQILETRKDADPAESYTARLLTEGLPRVAQKVGEEAVETVIAALTHRPGDAGDKNAGDKNAGDKNAGDKNASDQDGNPLVEEAADLLYHLLVLLLATGVEPGRLAAELQSRHNANATPRGAE